MSDFFNLSPEEKAQLRKERLGGPQQQDTQGQPASNVQGQGTSYFDLSPEERKAIRQERLSGNSGPAPAADPTTDSAVPQERPVELSEADKRAQLARDIGLQRNELQTLSDAAMEFNKPFNRAGEAMARGVVGAANAIGGLFGADPISTEAIDAIEPRERKELEEARRRSPFATSTANFARTALITSRIPGGATGGLIRRGITGLLGGTAASAADTVMEGEKRLQDAGVDLLIGGAAGATGGLLGGVLQKSFGSRALDIVGDEPLTAGQRAVMKAAQRDGIDLPAPSMMGPKAIQRMKRRPFVLSPEGEAKITDKIIREQRSGLAAIRKMQKNILPAGLKKTEKMRDEMFEVMKTEILDPDVVSRLSANKSIVRRLNDVLADPDAADAFRALPENSVARWNVVKQKFGDVIEVARRNGEEAKAIELSKHKRLLMNILSKNSSSFKEGNKLAQKVIVNRKINEAISKVNSSVPTAESSLSKANNFRKTFNALFGSESKGFVDELIEAGADPKTLKQGIAVLRRLNNNALKDISVNKSLDKTVWETIGERGLISGAVSSIVDKIRGKESEVAVELLTNPRWEAQRQKMLRSKTTKEFIGKFISTSGKIAEALAGDE